jgi:hypothetical protein
MEFNILTQEIHTHSNEITMFSGDKDPQEVS